ncbi:hypothetical protein D3C79_997220 [compost metagenome]
MHQVRHPQTGAGAIHCNRLVFLRAAAAELQHIVLRQHRDRHRHGGKVVDHFQVAQPQAGLHLFDRERPGMVSHRYPVFSDRTGNGNTGVLHLDILLG